MDGFDCHVKIECISMLVPFLSRLYRPRADGSAPSERIGQWAAAAQRVAPPPLAATPAPPRRRRSSHPARPSPWWLQKAGATPCRRPATNKHLQSHVSHAQRHQFLNSVTRTFWQPHFTPYSCVVVCFICGFEALETCTTVQNDVKV